MDSKGKSSSEKELLRKATAAAWGRQIHLLQAHQLDLQAGISQQAQGAGLAIAVAGMGVMSIVCWRKSSCERRSSWLIVNED